MGLCANHALDTRASMLDVLLVGQVVGKASCLVFLVIGSSLSKVQETAHY